MAEIRDGWELPKWVEETLQKDSTVLGKEIRKGTLIHSPKVTLSLAVWLLQNWLLLTEGQPSLRITV